MVKILLYKTNSFVVDTKCLRLLGVAHVPEGRRLFPLMTVEENLEMGSYLPLQTVDRAYVLENGKIVMEGKGTDLLENDHLKTAYLGL